MFGCGERAICQSVDVSKKLIFKHAGKMELMTDRVMKAYLLFKFSTSLEAL
jgi:hypothetical protein